MRRLKLRKKLLRVSIPAFEVSVIQNIFLERWKETVSYPNRMLYVFFFENFNIFTILTKYNEKHVKLLTWFKNIFFK